jgi:hypothetical protein
MRNAPMAVKLSLMKSMISVPGTHADCRGWGINFAGTMTVSIAPRSRVSLFTSAGAWTCMLMPA